MADDIQWITVNGQHIPVGRGESKKAAYEKAFSERQKTSKNNYKFNDSYESVEKAADIFQYDKYQSLQKSYEQVVSDFYKELGYDAKPHITNEKELERVAKASKYGLLERGYRGNNSEEIQNYINTFKHGDMYIGSQRAFGRGTYFGYGKDAHAIAHRYGQQNDDNILKATIAGNAKIITSAQISIKRDEFMDKAFKKASEINKKEGSAAANKYYTKMNKITMDDGVFAASLGYDAINVTDAKYMVVLNRGKVLVSE